MPPKTFRAGSLSGQIAGLRCAVGQVLPEMILGSALIDDAPTNKEYMMGYGFSMLLIAVGAILKFAVTATVSGVNISTIGVVLMVVGVAGLALTLVMMTARRRTDVTYRPDGATYVEPSAASNQPLI